MDERLWYAKLLDKLSLIEQGKLSFPQYKKKVSEKVTQLNKDYNSELIQKILEQATPAKENTLYDCPNCGNKHLGHPLVMGDIQSHEDCEGIYWEEAIVCTRCKTLYKRHNGA